MMYINNSINRIFLMLMLMLLMLLMMMMNFNQCKKLIQKNCANNSNDTLEFLSKLILTAAKKMKITTKLSPHLQLHQTWQIAIHTHIDQNRIGWCKRRRRKTPTTTSINIKIFSSNEIKWWQGFWNFSLNLKKILWLTTTKHKTMIQCYCCDLIIAFLFVVDDPGWIEIDAEKSDHWLLLNNDE